MLYLQSEFADLKHNIIKAVVNDSADYEFITDPRHTQYITKYLGMVIKTTLR